MTEIRIQRCLGRGGFGEVYKGVMSRPGGLEVDVAVKVLRGDLEASSQGIERLRDEGRLLGRLTHPSILRVYDLLVIEGRAALVSEYVAGDDLGRLVREDSLSPRAAFEVVAQVAAALDAAWSWPSVTDGKPLHLVHRDIKPDNIRIDPHGAVKLLDFGIAQAKTVEREARTSVNTIMGSTQYLAPERLVQQEVGPEADVFALGCTLFEALTGEALFARRSMRQMYLLMVGEDKFEQFLGERCGAFRERLVSDRVIALIRSMTAWKKTDRPTAAEVAARCDALSDTAEGLTLTQWCRSRAWPPPQEVDGPLEGQSFGMSADVEPLVPQQRLSLPDPGPVVEGPSGPVPNSAAVSTSMHVAGGPTPWSAAEVVAVFPPERPSPPWHRVPQLERQWPEPPRPPRATPTSPPMRPEMMGLDAPPIPVSTGPVSEVQPLAPTPIPETTDSTPAFPSIPPTSLLAADALVQPADEPLAPVYQRRDPESDKTDPATGKTAPNGTWVPDPSDPDPWIEAPTVRIKRPPELAEDPSDATSPSVPRGDLTLPPPEPDQDKQLPAVVARPSPPTPREPAPKRRANRFRSQEFMSVGLRFASSLAGLLLGMVLLVVLLVIVLFVHS